MALNCSRCGKCCNTVILALHNTPLAKDTQELGRWITYHGYDAIKIFNGKEDVLAIKLDGPCEYLETHDGLFYTCKIHKTRPQICKDHWCNRLNLEEKIDKVAQGLVEEKTCIKPL